MRKNVILKTVVIASLFFGLFNIALAANNIHNTHKWAWNDSVGWINFNTGTTNVEVTDTKIKGYGVISNSGDEFSFDCATSVDGNVCADTVNWFVSNDGQGNLAGWAWSDTLGWISFCGNTSSNSSYDGTTWDCPASPTYQVEIDNITGNFEGYAWNDSVGWISFNCANTDTCNSPNNPNGVSYRTRTTWHPLGEDTTAWVISKAFDTCTSGAPSCASGVDFNYILWDGNLPLQGDVKFQLATADCPNGNPDETNCQAGTVTTHPDNSVTFTGTDYWGANLSGDGAFIGPDGFNTSKYGPSNPRQAININTNFHNNKRYYRYRVFLNTTNDDFSPVVEEVIVNWSH